MNEKIRELAVESGINFYKKPVLSKDYPELYEGEYCESELEQQQKFAELIVKECINICKERHWTWRWDETTSGPNECAELIKNHFGVGE